MNVRPFLATAVLGLLAACASVPPPQIQRADQLPGAQAGSVRSESLPETMGNAGPRPVIRRGAGTPINQAAASAPPPSLASSGQAAAATGTLMLGSLFMVYQYAQQAAGVPRPIRATTRRALPGQKWISAALSRPSSISSS